MNRPTPILSVVEGIGVGAFGGNDGLRRRRIHGRLLRASMGGAKSWQDACLIASNQRSFASPTSLVAHALRELDGTMLALLLPDDFVDPDKSDTRKKKLDAISQSLGLDPWIAKGWQQAGFEKRAHSREVVFDERGEPPDSLIDDYADILDVVLATFELRFETWLGRLDQFLAIESPTNDQISQMKLAVPWSDSTLRYLFDRLERPSWLRPLRKKHFFDAPAGVERDDVNGFVRFRLWPQSTYLARVAAEEGPVVAEVVAGLPRNENPFMLAAVCSVAAALPSELYPPLHPIVLEWIRACAAPSFALGDLVSLVRHLASTGPPAHALALVVAMLRPTAPEAPVEPVALFTTEARSRLGQHEYHHACSELLNALHDAIPLPQQIAMLIGLLDEATTQSVGNEDAAPNEFSSSRRRTLDGDPFGPGEVWQSLVTNVVMLGRRCARSAQDEAERTAAGLLTGRWQIFRRIGLDLYREIGPSDASRGVALDRQLFLDPELEREYAALLSVVFPTLSASQQAIVLGWIGDGPDWSPPAVEDYELRADFWRLARLWSIQAHLDRPSSERFNEIQARRSASDPWAEPNHVVAWAGTTSPVDPVQLSEMADGAVIELMQSWSPEPWSPGRATPEGLGDSLSQAISQDPGRFAQVLVRLTECPAVYQRSAISGLASAVLAKRPIPWPQARTLIGRIMSDHERSPDGDVGAWACLGVVDLLEAALRTPEADLGHDDADWLVALATKLSTDRHPSGPDVQDETAGRLDVALNTVRGRALTLLVRLMEWLAEGDTSGSMSCYRTVQLALEHRIESETVSQVLAALGRDFRFLVGADPKWARMQADLLFGQSPATNPAWAAYLDEEPYVPAFRALRPFYDRHLQALLDTPGTSDHAAFKLAEHFTTMYWSGLLDNEDPLNGCIGQLFQSAAAVRAHTIEFVGLALGATDGDVEPFVLEHLTKLWEWRRAASPTVGSEPDDPPEYSGFSWWFTSGKLDTEWALSQLQWVLSMGVSAHATYSIAESLRAAVDEHEHVAAALSCLELLIQSITQPWGLAGWVEPLHETLQNLVSRDQSDRESVRSLANLLVARGYLAYRNLA